jgi:hypothetical protein
MSLTPYHARYFAHELTKRCASDSVDKLAGAVASAQVDLNPHQVDAALFAFNSPLAKGALLADEVGLGNPESRIASLDGISLIDKCTECLVERTVWYLNLELVPKSLADISG